MAKDVSKGHDESEEYKAPKPESTSPQASQEGARQPGWSRRRRQQQGLPASDATTAPQPPLTPQPERRRTEAVTGSVGSITKSPDVKTQNDIANVLMSIANMLPDGAIKDFIMDLAEWFENLSQNESFRAQVESQGLHVQGLIDGECMKKVADELRGVLNTAMLSAANELPRVLETFIGCFMGGGTSSRALELSPEQVAALSPQERREYKRAKANPQAGQPQVSVNFACLFQAAMTYWRTRDMTATLTAFLTCQFGNIGGGGGTGGGGGGSVSGFLNKPVVRCQA